MNTFAAHLRCCRDRVSHRRKRPLACSISSPRRQPMKDSHDYGRIIPLQPCVTALLYVNMQPHKNRRHQSSIGRTEPRRAVLLLCGTEINLTGRCLGTYFTSRNHTQCDHWSTCSAMPAFCCLRSHKYFSNAPVPNAETRDEDPDQSNSSKIAMESPPRMPKSKYA
jgi:hypothetical protein